MAKEENTLSLNWSDEKKERREKRSFGRNEYKGRSDRPRRRYEDSDHQYSDRPSRRFEDSDRRPREPKKQKPYGYDSFRPARNRGDDSKFFWNEDEN